MKKVLATCFAGVVVILVGTGAYFGYQGYLESRNPIDVATDYVSEVQGRRDYIFQAPKVKNKTELVDPDANPQIVNLYLGDGKYYPIEVPATDHVLTDYSTYVYNSDSSYSVQVVKGVTKDNMSSMFSMTSVEKVSQTIVKSKEGSKTPQICGILLYDDIGVVCTTYDNPVAFATLLQGIKRDRVLDDRFENKVYADDCVAYGLPGQIKTENVYPISVSPNEFNMAGTTQYNFDDGQLTQFSMMIGYPDALDEMLTRVAVANSGASKITAVCQTDGAVYFEIGDFTIFVDAKTINKSNCFLGQGDEARYNIATYYKQYCN